MHIYMSIYMSTKVTAKIGKEDKLYKTFSLKN